MKLRPAKGLRPRVATFLVTYRCNCRCTMCIIPSIPCGREMTAGEIGRVFRKIGRLHALRISGGEPFLRSDLADVINGIDHSSRPLMTVISTNGLLSRRIADTIGLLHHPRKVHFEISIDGVGDVHDEIRGRPGAFEAVKETISLLNPLRRKYGFSLNASQVIVDAGGFDQYRLLRELLDPLGVDLFPVIAYEPVTALYSGKRMLSDPEAILPYDEQFIRGLDKFLNDLLPHLPRRRWSVTLGKRYYLVGARNRIVCGTRRPNPPCTALRRHIRINPDGGIPVCMHNSHTVGNLVESSFRELWRGENAVKQRQWVNRCRGCWAGCEIVPNAVYSGDIIRAALPSFHRNANA